MSDQTITLTREQVAAIAAGKVRLRATDSQGYYVGDVELYEWARDGDLSGLLAEPVLVALAQRVERAEAERDHERLKYDGMMSNRDDWRKRAIDAQERADLVDDLNDRAAEFALESDERCLEKLAARDARIAELEAQLHAIKEECPSSRLQDYLDATPLECVKKSISWGIFQQSQRHLAAERVAELEAALREVPSRFEIERLFGGACCERLLTPNGAGGVVFCDLIRDHAGPHEGPGDGRFEAVSRRWWFDELGCGLLRESHPTTSEPLQPNRQKFDAVHARMLDAVDRIDAALKGGA